MENKENKVSEEGVRSNLELGETLVSRGSVEREKVIDLDGKTPREANSIIKKNADEYQKLKIANQKSMHYLLAVLRKNIEINIDGDVGYYFGTMIHGPVVRVNGRAGWYPADNMTSGEIILEGDGGDGAGQCMYGGT